jgi:hypothetical protein
MPPAGDLLLLLLDQLDLDGDLDLVTGYQIVVASMSHSMAEGIAVDLTFGTVRDAKMFS